VVAGRERGLSRTADLEAVRVDSGSPCPHLFRFLLWPALVARGGGGRRGGRLKAPLSLCAGDSSPRMEDGVKPYPTRPAVEARWWSMADQGRLDLAEARFESSGGFSSLRRLLCVGNIMPPQSLARWVASPCSTPSSARAFSST
jgi:hypothetical protein